MSEEISTFNAGGGSWNVPQAELRRQAVASLGGYAYQLHRSLSAWLGLRTDDVLILEVAEDYLVVSAAANEPRALTAFQVKQVARSVTLNSPDVQSAIAHLWSLQTANRGRPVQMIYLTTGEIATERAQPLETGEAGLEAWLRAARGGPIDAVRAALVARFDDELGAFVRNASDTELRERILRPMIWSCGEPDMGMIQRDNVERVIALSHDFGGSPELSTRTADVLLAHVLDKIVGGGDRRLTRGSLLTLLERGATVRVPARDALARPRALPRGRLDLDLADAWRPLLAEAPRRTQRSSLVQATLPVLGAEGCLWIYGATGLGKSMLAELIAIARGGNWRVLDLRGLGNAAAAERIHAARLSLASIPGFTGIVLDDLTAPMDGVLESVLRHLAASLALLNAVCVITAYDPPPVRMRGALDLTPAGVMHAPVFDILDVAELVAAYAGDPALWTNFVWTVAGRGHPQLVEAMVSGLAGRGWNPEEMQRYTDDGYSDDIQTERDAVRTRLLSELPPESFQLLSRTSRIAGSFDRELAVAAGLLAPELDDVATSLDRLTGIWIERSAPRRFRTSPLTDGLADAVLTPSERRTLDQHIVGEIMERDDPSPDLLDTAFLHALAGNDVPQLALIGHRVLATPDDARPAVAASMPLFRALSATTPALTHGLRIMMAIGRHRLATSVGDDAAVTASAADVFAVLRRIPADDTFRRRWAVMALQGLLNDDYAFGRLPDWFDWLRELDALLTGNTDLAERTGMRSEGHESDRDFFFIAHATHLRGVGSLADLFDRLDRLTPVERERWLMPFRASAPMRTMLIDNGWISAVDSGVVDGRADAARYDRMARLALGWGAPDLAEKAFRVVAILLDDYAEDRAAALASLDEAERLLPGHLELPRQRAKIFWRAQDYQHALDLFAEIVPALIAQGTMDAAFALREAAMSAGELGYWQRAEQLFAAGRSAAERASGRDDHPLAIGLGADGAASRFQAGDRAGGICDLVRAAALVGDARSSVIPLHRYLYLIIGHLAYWMGTIDDPEARVADGGAVRYSPGSASNPGPRDSVYALTLHPPAMLWFTILSVSIDNGLPFDEVLEWPGAGAVRSLADTEAMLRKAVLRASISRCDRDMFIRFFPLAAETIVEDTDLIDQGLFRDPMAPQPTHASAFDAKALSDAARSTLRNHAFAMALQLWLTSDNWTGLVDLHHGMATGIGYDLVPEWQRRGGFEGEDLDQTIALILALICRGTPVLVQDLFRVHLRLHEWLDRSAGPPIQMTLLAARMRTEWQNVLTHRRSSLLAAEDTAPAIQAVIDSGRDGDELIAALLLAAAPAVPVNLNESIVLRLQRVLAAIL